MEKLLPVSILSTRALGNAARDFIHHMNWWVDIVSMIETHGVLTNAQIEAILKDLNNQGKEVILLFSSENAVRWLKWAFDKFGYSMPRDLKAVCVGQKTRDTAHECLDVGVALTENNGALLLQTLVSDFPPDIFFVFFCGNKRLDTLPMGLKAKGFMLEEYVVYETLLTPHTMLKDYDAVLFFSPSAVESYFKVNTWKSKRVAVAIGHSTCKALIQSGVDTILVADEPNETSMLVKLQEYLANSN